MADNIIEAYVGESLSRIGTFRNLDFKPDGHVVVDHAVVSVPGFRIRPIKASAWLGRHMIVLTRVSTSGGWSSTTSWACSFDVCNTEEDIGENTVMTDLWFVLGIDYDRMNR